MTDEVSLRAESQSVLDEIVSTRLAEPGVDQGRMFSTIGWRVHGKVFAFVGGEGRLIVKLPGARVDELIAEGFGEPMIMRNRRMREWMIGPKATDEWFDLVRDALSYGRELHGP